MSTEKQKGELLFVWPYLEWGGAQIYFSGIMKLAVERCYRVVAVMPKGTQSKLTGYLQRLNVSCEAFDAHLDFKPVNGIWQKLRRRWRNASCEFVLAIYLTNRGLKGRIVHIDVGPWSSFLLLFYLATRCEVFVTLHIGLPAISSWRRWLWKVKFYVLRRMPGFHLLVSNLDMRESLRPYLPAGLLEELSVAYTAVDKNEIAQALATNIDRVMLREKYNLPKDRLLVFSLGQVIERKGCLVLLDAIKQIRTRNPSLFFVWIGSGEQEQEVGRLIVENDLQDTFCIVNPDQIGGERADLLAFLRLADLFVHPSFSEGLPGAMLEAMALGKACIASSVNAIPEAIIDRTTGLLVKPGDSKALARAIAQLVTDLPLRERLATAGQSFVLDKFDERRTAEITIEQYETCS